ncbi:MAG: glycosyltransferase family 2 protein [Candidatus Saganbacteria bacterium]|nr:glycosyltransferase family 2 protein [Candidatus Saganbacteria bacterium]
MSEKPELSVIIPVFNEAGSLAELYNRLLPVIKAQAASYEIIFVDDGSSDGSLSAIEELAKQDHAVKAVSFSRNFGHMIALSAGLDKASGRAVITMDADLQHPPELIPELMAKWKAGAQVVNTRRGKGKGVGFFKRITAGIFYWLINRIAKVNLPANAADYRLLDEKVVATLKQVRERSRFLRGLIRWVGFKQEFVDYQPDKRFAGRTKYSVSRMIAFAIDGITSFSTFPLRLATYIGSCIAFLGALYIIYALYVRFFTDQAIEGWASVLIAVLFIGGVQLVFLGILGEYLGRVFEEVKARPLYIINKQIGF